MTTPWGSEADDLDELRRIVADKIKDIKSAKVWAALPHQVPPRGDDWLGWLLLGGRGCIAPWTRIFDPSTGKHTPVAVLASRSEPITVLGLGADGPVSVRCAAPFRKGTAVLHTFDLEDGSQVTVTDQHRFLTADGWRVAAQIDVGAQLGCAPNLPGTSSAHGRPRSPEDDQRSIRTGPGCSDRCSICSRPCDAPPRLGPGIGPASSPSRDDALGRTHQRFGGDGWVRGSRRTRHRRQSVHQPRSDCAPYVLSVGDAVSRERSSFGGRTLLRHQTPSTSPDSCTPGQLDHVIDLHQSVFASHLRWHDGESLSWRDHATQSLLPGVVGRQSADWSRTHEPGHATTVLLGTGTLRPVEVPSETCLDATRWVRVVSKVAAGVGDFYDLHVPGVNSYLAEGIWHHNSGKTVATAKYVVDHVKGPPCMPGPIPHWIGIIAPTLGDAATSCFAGPAGIRSLDPHAELKQRPGGLIVEWPNHSQAKLFGAREPDDVERLRSGGNTSLATGTLVRAEHGEIPIEDVRVGDLVWTRNGLRRVLMAGQTGTKPVRKLITENGHEISMTGDHEVWAGTWRELDDVDPGETLTSWDTSSTTERAGMSAHGPVTTRTHGGILHSSIATSGPRKSARSRTMPSSITGSLGTRRPLTSAASNVSSRRVNTCASITHGRPTGTVPADTLRGISAPSSRFTASIAERCSLPVPTDGRSVARTARFPGTAAATFLVEHERGACALCAARSSRPRSEVRPGLVPDRVVRVEPPTPGKQPVYDLLVEDDHEFFANGVLVANCLVWCEELAAWRYLQEAFDQMRFGLRVGPHPRWIGSTTPKPRPLIRKMHKGGYRGVEITHATMYDNPHLPPHIKEALEEAYSGTTLGSQELYGMIIEQDELALFNRETIEHNRLKVAPDMRKVEVGVDPSGGQGEQGIIVIGSTQEIEEPTSGPKVTVNPVTGMAVVTNTAPRLVKRGYVLDDRTVRLKPDGWGRAAVQAAVDWDADRIVVEINFGGDMAVSTIASAAENMGIPITIKTVRASRGKAPRAQPVSAMAVQGRWHHVGRFDELEDQCCTWHPDLDWSPDRLDAAVWPAWHMKLVSTITRTVGSFGGNQMVARTFERRRPA